MNEKAAPTRFEPTPSVAGTPYWEGTHDQRLLLPWCVACGLPHWYPREFCPHCLATELDWRAASGKGTVYAASTMPGAAATVVLVDLAEGVRVFSEVVGVPAGDVAVGLAVEAAWEPRSDGRHLLQFRAAPD